MNKPRLENTSVLVVGGGIAGLTCAWELSLAGAGVLLVEKGPFIGGHAANLACKATDRCLKCNDCLVEERLKAVSLDRSFDIRVGTDVVDVERTGKRFSVCLMSEPRLIDENACIDCGLCAKECPEAGAIVRAPSPHIHPFYAIDRSTCRHFNGRECGACLSACPEKAVSLEGETKSWSVEVDGLVVATGFQPFDPREKRSYNFDHFSNMVSAMDLEKMLRSEGRVARVSDGSAPANLAFIQCVGSRDMRLNHEFCSRVCCGYALRMGLKVVHDAPGTEVTVFYMDVQNFGKDYDRYYGEAQSAMRLIRGLPGDFYAADGDRVSLSYFDEGVGKTVSEAFDLVVLSVGIMPGDSNSFFRDKLGLHLNEDGFLTLHGFNGDSGIVIAGTSEGPMDVSEAISHAKGAALDMAGYLEGISAKS
jgi:heterodisulfide reductase subunit A2